MEKRWECKLNRESKKRLDQIQQCYFDIETAKNETLALTREERREEVAVVRHQLMEEELRRMKTERMVQCQQEQIGKTMGAVAGLSDTMCLPKGVLVKEQQLRK